jgi:hypothetical protein
MVMKNLIKRVLCDWLHFHAYGYFSMALSFQQAFPDRSVINRRCLRCEKMWEYNEKTHLWSRRG